MPMKFFTKESLKARFSFVLPVSAELIFTLFSALFTGLSLFSGDGSPVTAATLVLALLTVAAWIAVSLLAKRFRSRKLLIFQTVFWFAALLIWLASLPLNGIMTGSETSPYYFFLALNFPVLGYLALIAVLDIQTAVIGTVLTPIPAIGLAVFSLVMLLRLQKENQKNGKQTQNRKDRSR